MYSRPLIDKAILYRAAATRNAVIMAQITRNPYDPDGGTNRGNEFLDTIKRVAKARKWQAVQYQTLNLDNFPEECLEMVAGAFVSSGEVCASMDAHIDDVEPDRMGSIPDADIPASRVVIAAFDTCTMPPPPGAARQPGGVPWDPRRSRGLVGQPFPGFRLAVPAEGAMQRLPLLGSGSDLPW